MIFKAKKFKKLAPEIYKNILDLVRKNFYKAYSVKDFKKYGVIEIVQDEPIDYCFGLSLDGVKKLRLFEYFLYSSKEDFYNNTVSYVYDPYLGCLVISPYPDYYMDDFPKLKEIYYKEDKNNE